MKSNKKFGYKIILLSIILCLPIIPTVLFPSNPDMINDYTTQGVENENPKTSITNWLYYGITFALVIYFMGRSAEDWLEWEFTGTNTDVGVTVYVMDGYNYGEFLGGLSYNYIELSDGSYYTDSGMWEVPYYDTWYISFINWDPDIEYTWLDYNGWWYLDDAYEDNDVRTNAYSINETTWYNGIQWDDDWYQISITSGYERLIVDLQFTDADGDIDLTVYNSVGTYVTASTSATDDEYIDYVLPSSGTYYLKIHHGDAGNAYNLWWDTLDDAYEENDVYSTAYDLTGDEHTWLSTIAGLGIQSDDDWYEIYITPGFERLMVNCTFINSAGDIDIAVYASDGTTQVTYSESKTDNEYIDYILPSSGTYYIRVYYSDAGNAYNLWWDDLTPPISDDNYEENDLPIDAYDLTGDDNTWLSTIAGMGIQSDTDIYEIYVLSGYERVIINCTFTHALGNINIQLWNSTLDGLWASYFTIDDEYIDYIVPSAGVYYIIVYGDDAGNSYDLWWDALLVSDDAYEENDADTTAYDLTSYPDTWLTAISGPGIQSDLDFYKVSITLPNQRIIIDLTYTYSEGPLFLTFTDSLLNPLALSNTTSNSEQINQVLTATGTFYILVFGLGMGNSYDLKYKIESIGDETEIPGYNLLFLIGALFGISIILIRKRFKKLVRIEVNS